MDEIDRASEAETKHRQKALAAVTANIKKGTGQASRMTCIECGEPIPKKRREAVPGCDLCVDCQAEKEVY